MRISQQRLIQAREKQEDSTFRVTNRQLSTISVAGGAECGFVVALAEWLFGLSTAVVESLTGNVIRKSGCEDSSYAQVSWILISGPDALEQDLDIKFISKSYIIPNGNDIFVAGDISSRHLSGRISWDSVLVQCFSEKGSKLLELPVALGTALGAAARIFKAAASGDFTVTLSQRR